MSALGGAGAGGGGGGGGGVSPGASAAGSPGTTELLTVTVVRNDSGYGMKVSAANPVYVQSVKEGGAAWRAGLRAGDRIMRVNGVPVHTHTHEQVVDMIRASPNAVLTVYQNSQRLKTPITAPVPVDQEKQRQLEFTKVHTIKLMLENEQKHMEVLRNELSKGSEPRKQAELESAEQRCLRLQHQIDIITSSLPAQQDLSSSTPQLSPQPQTPRLGNRSKYQTNLDKNPTAQTNSTGFLSGLPRSLSNLTGQSLRNLRQVRQNMTNKGQQENQPPLERQNSTEESRIKRSRHVHNNTVPMVPVTCLDGNIAPPPLPPRSTDRPQKPKRNPLSPPPSHIPINPLAKPPKILSPSSSMSQSPAHRWHSPQKELSPYKSQKSIMPQYSMDVPHAPLTHKSTSSPQYRRDDAMSPQNQKYRRSAHSLDTEYGPDVGNGQPNSIAMQMSYPLIAHPQPPIQMDVRTGSGIPVMHGRSQSSPEHLNHALPYSTDQKDGQAWERTPPPGTPPPPYPHARPQPCDTQRAIISMEEDDSPTSDNSCHSGLFSNLRSVRESKARTAVLLNWLLGERRCASGNIFLLITDGYRSAVGVPIPTLRRWAYEIQSTFVMPHAVLALNGVDENIAREIDDILLHEYEKEELLRNVFRKARAKAKEELAQQLSEFQVKRQVGLGMLYGPEDSVLEKCDVDKAQESTVVERLIADRLKSLCSAGGEGDVWGCGAGSPPHAPLLAATAAAALALHVRPQVVTAAVGGGARAAFLQRDKHYKQRLKQIAKQTPHPLIVRGHHFSLQAVTSVADCQQCCTVIWGLAPQAYICTDCNLRVHRSCARKVEESCCLDGEQHNNRISRLLDKIHPNAGHEANEKKPRKTSATTHFINTERSMRKLEDEQTWELHTAAQDRRDESDESLYESADGNSDPISASDDALPRMQKLQAVSRESVKLAVTDEEIDPRNKKGHRKALSLSNPIEMVKSLGDEWFEAAKREMDKNSDKKKSKESLWSEEDRDSIHGSNAKLNERKNSKKDDKKKGSMDPPKSSRKVGSVSALNFLRRKKKTIETVAEKEDRITPPREAISTTTFFIEAEKRHSCECQAKPIVKAEVSEELQEESDEELEAEDEESEEQTPVKLISGASRRRLSRTTSRSKSKVRGKSQTVRVNTLRKSQSGTLKRAKKKNVKGASGRSRNASVVELTPVPKKKTSDTRPPHYWPFSGSIKGEARREGSAEESACADAADPAHEPALEKDDGKDGVLWRSLAAPGGKPVNRAESCREPAASSRRSKQRNASDPNRLTANKTHDCEPGAAAGAPSGSSSSSSLSSRSNESGAPPADQHASQSDWSEEEEPLAEQWIASVPQHIVDTLSSRLRKRQELIHELITSESSHVRWLKVLQTVFLRPLERGEHGQLLSPDEVKALFPNLPAVRERHNRLYADLKLLRKGDSQIVQIRPLAEAVLNTLGDASYATCLSRFCRGQRMALDALRERRRKNKELQHFLSTKEQQPLCGRLQLKDLLAVVWQRLTKYQLLLEGVLKTILDEDEETEEDIARLKLALDIAKDVLHRVDSAIRTAENEHRLRSIQSKLEVRSSGPSANSAELEEMRRLDLTSHTLLYEGDLSIRTDTKKSNVLALLLAECLVLLQREGDKFVLKMFQTSQTFQTPIIKWSTVLFRPNAAVKNTFFLMNINVTQMYELSANSPTEYNAWTKYISEAPLAEANKSTRAPSVLQRSERADDSSGGGVSRNASDASRTSASSTAPDDQPESHSTPEKPADRPSLDRASVDRPSEDRSSVDRSSGERSSTDREKTPEKPDEKDPNIDTKPRPQLTMNGRITTHEFDPPPLAAAVHVETTATSQFAQKAVSTEERLRRLDEGITKALKAKSLLVGEMLGVPTDNFNAVADLAVAETLGEVDVSKDLKASRLERTDSVDTELPPGFSGSGMHQLLLAAQAQANQLTETLTRALNVTESDVVSARHYAPWRDTSGLCDTCTKRRTKDRRRTTEVMETAIIDSAQTAVDDLANITCEDNVSMTESMDKSKMADLSDKSLMADLSDKCKMADVPKSLETSMAIEKEVSFDMLSELGRSCDDDNSENKKTEAEQRLSSIVLEEIGETSTDPVAGGVYDSALATRLVPLACGLQGTLARLLHALPALEEERARLRRELAAERDAHDCLRRRARGPTTEEAMEPPLEPVDQNGQDQMNNGG